MSERPCLHRSFRLGPWVIDLDEPAISGQGESTRIDHKAMHVLSFLADHEGETVTREAILDHVWPDTAVTDDVLTVAISTLRRALGDDAREPTFIRTLPKRGYRLLMSASAIEAPPATRGVQVRGRTRYAAAAVGLLLTVSLVLVWSLNPGTAPGPTTIRSIAILPFKDFSEAQSRQHIADGMTEALTTHLAKTGNFAVTSRTTAARYDDSSRTVAEIGRELGVDAVLEGSVQVSDGQLRLHAQLIDAKTDEHVWAEEYDRPLEDILRLQSSLAATVINTIEDRTIHAEHSPRVNPDAYELYLKARYLRNQESPEGISGAMESLERSIEISPDFAMAHATMAEIYFYQVERGLVPAALGFSRGLESAERALALQPDLAEAHAARAIAAFSLKWDFAEADREFELALEGGDRSIGTLKWYVRFLVVTQRFTEAVEAARRIQQIDSLSYVNLMYVHALDHAGQFEAALSRLREIESILPSSPGVHAAYAQIYMHMGHHEEAAESLLALAEAAQWPARQLETLREAFATRGSEGVYRYFASAASPLTSGAIRARFHAALGQTEQALMLLEESVSSRDMNVLWIKADRGFDRLRSSARFRRLVDEVGLS